MHHAGTTADLLAEAEVPSVASDARPLVEAHREFVRWQIRKCTKEAEQHRLTKYYSPGW